MDFSFTPLRGQLAALLGLNISQLAVEELPGGSEKGLLKVTVADAGQEVFNLALKPQEDSAAWRFYQRFLEPFALDSPRVYGEIELDGLRYLVMEYIPHLPARWDEGSNYLDALEWLVKKDRLCGQHLEEIKRLDCFASPRYSGTDYWLQELARWQQAASDDPLALEVWRCASAKREAIDEAVRQLGAAGAQTVVHGDLQMSNVLWGQGPAQGRLYVIDWTEPHVGSVTQDLASLYDNAPSAVKGELLQRYRAQIDFPGFEEVFRSAKLLRDTGYLAWMVGEISAGRVEDIAREELERVASSLLQALNAGP